MPVDGKASMLGVFGGVFILKPTPCRPAVTREAWAYRCQLAAFHVHGAGWTDSDGPMRHAGDCVCE